MNTNQGLNFFSDEELKRELASRNKEKNSSNSFLYFLNAFLVGKRLNGDNVFSVRLKKEHIIEPDTPANDWWGKEYDVQYIEILLEHDDSITINNLNDLLNLNLG